MFFKVSFRNGIIIINVSFVSFILLKQYLIDLDVLGFSKGFESGVEKWVCLLEKWVVRINGWPDQSGDVRQVKASQGTITPVGRSGLRAALQQIAESTVACFPGCGNCACLSEWAPNALGRTLSQVVHMYSVPT